MWPRRQCQYNTTHRAVNWKLSAIFRRRSLQWYGHITRSSGLAETIPQAQWKDQEEDAAKRRNGWMTSQNGLGMTSPQRNSRMRTVRNGASCSDLHLLRIMGIVVVASCDNNLLHSSQTPSPCHPPPFPHSRSVFSHCWFPANTAAGLWELVWGFVVGVILLVERCRH